MSRVPDRLMTDLYFLSFAAGAERYLTALQRLKAQANATGWFAKVYILDSTHLNELNPFWYKRHSDFLFSNRRLFGYCIWKPMIIAEMLRRIPLGSVLLYSDAGAELSVAGVNRLREFLLIVNKVDMIGFHTPYDVGNWTKGDLLNYFGYSLEDSILSSKQICCNCLFIKNNSYNRALFNAWTEIVVAENYRLVDDSPSSTPNPSGFVENRHDQAVFDLLRRSLDYGLVLSESEHTDNELWAQGLYDPRKPIQQMRNLSGIARIPS